MKSKKYISVLDVSRMLEIDQNIEILTVFNLTEIEREYMDFAIKMPTSEIKTFIEFYDNSSPKYDELKFVLMLEERYNESRENIIKRINQVRKIIKYEKQIDESKSSLKTLKK